MEVDKERLRSDIERTGEFGALDGPGRGRTNLVGTPANRKAREYLVERLEAAGLSVRIDAVGNIAGRWTPASADADASPVAAGSHLDSVPEGGIFDGPLGVYAALEAVRAMQEAEMEPERPIDVVSFTEEEGSRFALMLGSSVAAGQREIEDALTLRDDGETVEDVLESIGFRGDGRLDAGAWDAWLELHVEQGRRLESADLPVGVVSAITGICHAEATFEGAANHAGTTPMGERYDALAAASEFVLDVESAVREIVANASPTAVGTVGRVSASPNATNVVPGFVELGVDIRDIKAETMDEIVARTEGSLTRIESERDVKTDLRMTDTLEPSPMSDRVVDSLTDAIKAASLDVRELASGAGHDSQNVADVTDAGMLFARSRDGISHSPEEWTTWDDCATATRVLGTALADLAGV